MSEAVAKKPNIIGFEIPEETVFPWSGAKPLRHFVMTMTRSTGRRQSEMNLPPRALVFFKVERTPRSKPTATTLAEALNVAERLVAKDIDRYFVRKAASSFDFDVRQCWLLIELDPTINWRFSTSHPAATTKSREVPEGSPLLGMNVSLRYLYIRNGKVEISETATGEHCRFILFGVVQRPPNVTQSFNLFVEFYQEVRGGKGVRIIPVIIDPDIPETGHNGFP